MPSARPLNLLPPPPPTSVERPRVLFVDDEPLVLGLLQRLIEHEDVETRTAANGFAALSLLIEWGEPAVVVSDYSMARMTGIELLDSILERWPNARTILYTAAADSDIVLEAAQNRHKVLTKNTSVDVLRAVIMRAVRRPRNR